MSISDEKTGENLNIVYAKLEGVLRESMCKMKTPLIIWDNFTTHYFFRCSFYIFSQANPDIVLLALILVHKYQHKF